MRELIGLDKLANGLHASLKVLREFPVRKIIKTEERRSIVKGRVSTREICRTLFTKPTARVLSSANRVTANFSENRLIKRAIDYLLRNRSEIDQIDEAGLRRYAANMVEIQNVWDTQNHPETHGCSVPQLRKAVAFSRMVLYDQSFLTCQDIFDMQISLYKEDHRLFQHVVLESFRKVDARIRAGSVVVSTSKEITFNPDIVFEDAGVTSMIGDVKYKFLDPKRHGARNKPDIYQAIAHSLAYTRSNYIYLVYPKRDSTHSCEVVLNLDLIQPSCTIAAVWVDYSALFRMVARDAFDHDMIESVQGILRRQGIAA